jgi:D-glycero-alpha-D-manno-heptose-7-phosphate kinase
VGLLNALYAFQGVSKPPLELAEQAAHIEIDVLGKPIGRQDQYAAAAGGVNFIEFLRGGAGVRVEPLICPPETFMQLQRSLLLFYTGRQRSADSVLHDQRQAIEDGVAVLKLKKMRDLAFELRERLSAGDVSAVGSLLSANWELKRDVAAGISNADVDRWYDAVLAAGANGAKLLGAGGGGFFLAFAPPQAHEQVRRALSDLREVPIRFAARGTHITLFEHAEP